MGQSMRLLLRKFYRRILKNEHDCEIVTAGSDFSSLPDLPISPSFVVLVWEQVTKVRVRRTL
jgi:hypothetical protein